MSHASGSKFDVIAPRSKFYHGPFGRLCPDLPAWSPPGVHESKVEAHFLEIANQEMIEAPGEDPGEIAADPDWVEALDQEFGSELPAGYTYFGQFVDHDITFDPASSLMRQNDPNGLLNHRTPRLDLDNIYGRGPSDSPYLYDQDDKGKLLIGQVPYSPLPDLPRNSQGRALIGDMRNDENAMVSQLQLAFLLAHNCLVDRAKDQGAADPFEAARATLRKLYQHIVWHDFLARITDPKVHGAALSLEKTADGRKKWSLGLDDVYNWKHDPFMPVEFSVAAYRFGHSLVRNAYRTNDPHRGGQFTPIFDNTGEEENPDDLRGFRPMTEKNSIQWDWLLEMASSYDRFPQRARRIDTKLSNALAALHEDEAGSPLNVLAFRNLMRGWRFGLPAGTDVAKKCCAKPADVQPSHDSLWFYILKEAEESGGQRLGRVGSTIVCATFAGLLQGEPTSWFNLDPCWSPDEDPLLDDSDNQDPGNWTLASIIRLSGLPVSADDFAYKA